MAIGRRLAPSEEIGSGFEDLSAALKGNRP